MPTWLALVLCALASHRLTRLVVADSIADRPRTWLTVHLPALLAKVISCAWCVGFWIAGGFVAGAVLSGLLPRSWWVLWLAWPAVASGAGAISTRMP